MRNQKADVVTFEVVKNRLIGISLQQEIVLRNTAYSPVVKEMYDLAGSFFDSEGALVAESEVGLSLLLSSMAFGVKNLLQKYRADTLQPGDMVIASHPYRGTSYHANDTALYRPIFYDGRLVGFFGNIAHYIDHGGMSQNVPGCSSIQDVLLEGIMFPPTKLFKGDVLDSDIWDFFCANIRMPDVTTGDLNAQAAGLKLAEREFRLLADRYGIETVLRVMRELPDYSERRMRSEIRKMPDGEYRFEDYLDCDPLTRGLAKVSVNVRVEGDEICFDFTGSDPQQPGWGNSNIHSTRSAAYFALKNVTDAEIPANDGCYRPLTVIAPEGSVVNCSYPHSAAANGALHNLLVEVINGALAKALPDKVAAASNDSLCIFQFAGYSAKGDFFVHAELTGGGGGAGPGFDGADVIDVYTTNCSNLPVESGELADGNELQVSTHEMILDSGGPGKYRGGLGLRRTFLVKWGCHLTTLGCRYLLPPWGLMGGMPGKPSRFTLNPGTPNEKVFFPMNDFMVEPGDVLEFCSPGSGGWGNPLERDPRLVLKDVLDGKVSLASARDDYGVVMDIERRQVESGSTEELRKQIAAQRPLWWFDRGHEYLKQLGEWPEMVPPPAVEVPSPDYR
jgi:N-methylhydantoinase B